MSLSMNRRTFVLSFAAAAGSVLLAGCGGAPAATSGNGAGKTDSADADTTSANATSKLIVGFDAAYPPYGYADPDNPGSYTGFDIELAQELTKRLDWELQLEPLDWANKDAQLNSGVVNCLWNGFTMEGREEDYTFSEPYMLNGQVIVVKKDSGVTSFDDLAGKNVITQDDSAAQEVLEGDKADLASTFASLEVTPDYNTAFMQLESGAVDAVACDLSIAAYQLAAKPDVYLQLDENLSSEHYAVAFKKGDTATADKVTETLKAMDTDGFVKDLCDKYSDQGISYDNWCLQ